VDALIRREAREAGLYQEALVVESLERVVAAARNGGKL